ncbi:hypothetical protein BIW11_09708 [Tropilaelaps mercedesae]|uniref:Uncharacterized protein n=1 Tax=Tropilaelaps mercedesae TaxID=418985 RepID=A0A1V9XJ55_9ACAR|nr:hypothetical protein BIW11_09708 [Tropilaelaps mercedesae]
MPYVNLLTGTFLTVNNSKEVRSILEEYRPHLEALVNGDFCVKVREGTGASLWEQLNPNEFSADEFFNQLLCKHKLIRSYLESQPFPEELKVVSSESMAELRWILDHAEKLYNAINREFRNFRANH